jgi:hypothetical protein
VVPLPLLFPAADLCLRAPFPTPYRLPAYTVTGQSRSSLACPALPPGPRPAYAPVRGRFCGFRELLSSSSPHSRTGLLYTETFGFVPPPLQRFSHSRSVRGTSRPDNRPSAWGVPSSEHQAAGHCGSLEDFTLQGYCQQTMVAGQDPRTPRRYGPIPILGYSGSKILPPRVTQRRLYEDDLVGFRQDVQPAPSRPAVVDVSPFPEQRSVDFQARRVGLPRSTAIPRLSDGEQYSTATTRHEAFGTPSTFNNTSRGRS